LEPLELVIKVSFFQLSFFSIKIASIFRERLHKKSCWSLNFLVIIDVELLLERIFYDPFYGYHWLPDFLILKNSFSNDLVAFNTLQQKINLQYEK